MLKMREIISQTLNLFNLKNTIIVWHQESEQKRKWGFKYNSTFCRQIGCVCASEAGSQLSCVLEAMDAATAADWYLPETLVVIIVLLTT